MKTMHRNGYDFLAIETEARKYIDKLTFLSNQSLTNQSSVYT